MKNPFGDQQIPGSYQDVKQRIYKKVSAKVNDQIRMLLQDSYEHALNEENIILSRPERKRLYSQVVAMVMADLSGNLG
ncbi:MAG TPA: hypothetical protein PLX14_04450 [Anaerolineales bacterium]|nr:hypothetical protein [Anaerolineales bacterium]